MASCLLIAGPTRAEGPLGPNGSEIRTSEYAIDMSQGLVLDGTRPIGLGGAYVAVAETVDGIRQNPAAPAVRMPYSFEHVDFDWGLGVVFPTTVADGDFFNSGERTTDLPVSSRKQAFAFLLASGLIQWGPWGLGASLDVQQYGLLRATDPGATTTADSLTARFLTGHLQLARSFGDLIAGVGGRLTGLSVVRNSPDGGEKPLFELAGTAWEAGLLWRPEGVPFRAGLSARSAITSNTPTTGDEVIESGEDRILPEDPSNPTDPNATDSIYLPRRVVLPWDVNLGFSVQLGPRPFNPPWVDPASELAAQRQKAEGRRLDREQRRAASRARARKRGDDPQAAETAADAELADEALLDERRLAREEARVKRELASKYALRPRRYVLFTAALLISGPVDDAVGVESFLQRRVNRSGERPTFSPRLGVESEIVPNWLRMRAGSYLEPSRFSTPQAGPRAHSTLGLDARILSWTVFGAFQEGTAWRISGVLDAAPRYLGWGASLGIWW